MITGARNGVGAALVLRGEPGIGKTALLGDVTSRLAGVRVVRCHGFEAESAMAYSALQRLVLPLARHLPALPERQQRALRVATGVEEGTPPDGYLVGLGMLGLLDRAARVEPVVCVIDDAHWLDDESLDTLAFVARRLQAESVALLFALRDDDHLDVRLAGVPSVSLTGLDTESAVTLLTRSLSDVIDPLAAARIAHATGGNPLALIDLARELSVRQLTDSTMGDEPIPVGRRLEAHYVRQVRLTPPQVQLWLLVAAADSTGSADLVRSAAEYLDLGTEAAATAEQAGLVVLDSAVTFRHPLVRSAVYGAATGSERRRVHAALARAADDLGLAELEAWHAARATFGTDPAVAERLERMADRAGARGGSASRARVLARSADLTPPGPERSDRLISAAEAAVASGSAQVTHALLDRLDVDALDVVQQGRVIAARSSLAAFVTDPRAVTTATEAMLRAADHFHGVDPQREQTALLRAFEFALPAERHLTGMTLDALGRRLAAGAEVADGPAATVLRGLSAHVLEPYEDAVPAMRAAVHLLGRLSDEELLRFGYVGVALATALWDERAREVYLSRVADAARDTGSSWLLHATLWVLSIAELSGGSPRRAGEYVERAREVRRALGYPAEDVVNVAHLAWTGAPRSDVEAIAGSMLAAGLGGLHTSAVGGLGVRDLAEGRYQDAYERLRPLIEHPFLQATYLQLPDFVEAAARSAHPGDARPAVLRLRVMADASGSAWADSVAARSEALVADDHEAEAHYLRSLDALRTSDRPVDLARAHLLYGEWLRRNRRRRDAADHLRVALEIFERVGALPFADRARAELIATGARVDVREPNRPLDLTPQEAAIARLAAQGRTNVEIGATLFISANTVDYHLRKVFRKLAISSRRQLSEYLAAMTG